MIRVPDHVLDRAERVAHGYAELIEFRARDLRLIRRSSRRRLVARVKRWLAR